MNRYRCTFAAAAGAALAVTTLTAAPADAGHYDRTVVVRRTYTLPTYRSYPATTYVAVDTGCVQTPVYRSRTTCVPRPVYAAPVYRSRGVRFGIYHTKHRGHHWRGGHDGGHHWRGGHDGRHHWRRGHDGHRGRRAPYVRRSHSIRRHWRH